MVLNSIRIAQGAQHQHGDRNGCLKGTRGVVLDQIELWARDFNEPPVYWLNGIAGTGKTTIAQTIAERLFANGQLGASFFCSRDSEDRKNIRFIFPTLAVQLARKYTEFRSILIKLVQSDPEVTHESLQNQMNKLIVQPLKESNISVVTIIDALDECQDTESTSAILSVIGKFASEIPKVKFFITGRPEPRIRQGFHRLPLSKATDVFTLHEVVPSQVNSDIQLFFEHNFSELRNNRHGLDDWPSQEQLDMLCLRTAGLFVYAMATVKFISKQNSDPKSRLDLLLRSTSIVHEAKTRFNGNTILDSLYSSILQDAFGDCDPEDYTKVRLVLGAVILATNPLSPSTISKLLGFDVGGVFQLLSSAHSLLILQDDINLPVRVFHKSFPDFIMDSDRCSHKMFYISPLHHHQELLVGCLNLMNKQLEKNMCNLPPCVTNSEVADLQQRTEQCIDHGLQYACMSWHKHLDTLIPANTSKASPILQHFLEKKFLFWLEVLSILSSVREAVDALGKTANWFEVC